MIDPKQFYSEKDHPDSERKLNTWKGISEHLLMISRTSKFIFDRKSFVYGMAASFILMFTIIGIYSTVKQIVEHAQPQEIKTDKAYQTAIHEFENIVYSTKMTPASSGKGDLPTLRKTRLTYLNGAIDELKQGLNSHDLSPLKRQRLLELYNLKLTLLQEMLHQGDIEL